MAARKWFLALLTLSCIPYSRNCSLLETQPAINYGEERNTFLLEAKIVVESYQDYPDEKINRITSEIWSAGNYFNIDPYLLLGVFALESGFDSSVVSSANAQGIGQFLPSTWEWISKEASIPDSLSIVSYTGGIWASAYYLSRLRFETGSIDCALQLYAGFTPDSRRGRSYVNRAYKYVR